MTNRTNLAIAVLIVFHLVGLIGIAHFEAANFLNLTPLNLLISLALVFWVHVDKQKSWVMPLTILAGFLIELVGVKTGFPFGTYTYGTVLGPKLFETPLIIGVNWLLLLYGSNSLARKIAMTPWAQALVAAGLMVMVDFFIEPVAIRFDFWSWPYDQPPLSNYLGWFGVAALLSLWWQFSRIQLNTRMANAVYLVQLLFFGTLNLMA
jgi:uncharacterized membrane protein